MTDAIKTKVAVVKAAPGTGEAIEAAVRRAVELAGGLPVEAGSTVLVKPNLVVVPSGPEAGICTNVHVVKAVADLVREAGAVVIIGEASAPSHDTFVAMEAMGYDLLREHGYELVDMAKSETMVVEIPGAEVLKEFTTFRLAVEADAIISLPVMKTHCQADITLSLKNIMGTAASVQKPRFHYEGLYDCIVDANTYHRPVFAVVDGITGQEGAGPTAGWPIQMNLIVAGRDLVAVDATCARIMAFDPAGVEVIRRAAARGLGALDADAIDVVGESIEAVRRRFMRVMEDPRPPMDRLTIVQGEDERSRRGVEPCQSCRTSLAAALMMMENAGTLDHVDDVTFLIGDAQPPEGADKVVAVGRCCIDELKGLPGFAPGCVPRSSDIAAAVLEVNP